MRPSAALARSITWTRCATWAVVAGSLTSCVVVPRTVVTYDQACRVYARQVTLDATPISGVVLNCGVQPASCTAALVMAGIVSSASVVVSGSLAIVGNVAYWIEKQGQCNGVPPAAS